MNQEYASFLGLGELSPNDSSKVSSTKSLHLGNRGLLLQHIDNNNQCSQRSSWAILERREALSPHALVGMAHGGEVGHHPRPASWRPWSRRGSWMTTKSKPISMR
jgi:hypothetical protein